MDLKLKKTIESAVENEVKQGVADLAVKTIKKVYSGNFWLVGGYISNIAIPIIHDYSLDKPTDVDIVLQEPFDCSLIPDIKSWERTKTFHDGLRYLKDEEGIDIWTLDSCFGIKKRGLDLTIQNYLLTVPLTSQALAYDFDKKEIYNEIGLRALETKTVEVNDQKEIEQASWRPWKEYLQRKANKLKFKAIF